MFSALVEMPVLTNGVDRRTRLSNADDWCAYRYGRTKDPEQFDLKQAATPDSVSCHLSFTVYVLTGEAQADSGRDARCGDGASSKRCVLNSQTYSAKM